MINYMKLKKWQGKYPNPSLKECLLQMSKAENGIDTADFCKTLCSTCQMTREQASQMADQLLEIGAIYIDKDEVNYLFDKDFSLFFTI